MIRPAAILAAIVVLAVVFGARSPHAGEADPVRRAWLIQAAAAQADAADRSLADAERLMQGATDEARRGQAAVLAGDDDPAEAMTLAAAGFESAAEPLSDARETLITLRWTLNAIDPALDTPDLTVAPADARAGGAQWRAAALPGAALADLRHDAEAAIKALDDALAALEAGDPDAALVALDSAEAQLDDIRPFEDSLPTLGYWVETVEALIGATRGIALAAQAGDPAALAEAQAAYDTAAADANRADQALTIALGEAVVRITGPASASSAAALRGVDATRVELAALSILH